MVTLISREAYVCDLRIATRVFRSVLGVAQTDIEVVTDGVAGSMTGILY